MHTNFTCMIVRTSYGLRHWLCRYKYYVCMQKTPSASVKTLFIMRFSVWDFPVRLEKDLYASAQTLCVPFRHNFLTFETELKWAHVVVLTEGYLSIKLHTFTTSDLPKCATTQLCLNTRMKELDDCTNISLLSQGCHLYSILNTNLQVLEKKMLTDTLF